ncbi:hypothetical protein [Methylobacterium nonmethylotrophicum]|uniref:Uncharacterized protein n=1 Tax=Methylobacterium nonmethylotrophicum TaxID=1141884 RepID=A0A4Z0NLP3_9HYPH|nr:hypothetical protein [Methylobacterium nonmethylotrophicum]TGD96775.1 hypothetical protein EU555_22215 [Methylobacterium nonmethylotrophicum]
MRVLVRTGVAASAALVLSLLSAHAQAQTHDLPRQVQDEINTTVQDCRPRERVFGRGFVSRKDVNGDGIPDVILDYGAYKCGDQGAPFCGSAGCNTTVFASTGRGGYVKVLDENVRNLKFRTVNGRPAMVLNLHGSACGKAGAEPCPMTLTWNGARFVRSR